MHGQHPWLKLCQCLAGALCVVVLVGCGSRSTPLDPTLPAQPVSARSGERYVIEDVAAAHMLAESRDRKSQSLKSWQELAPALRASRTYASTRESGQVAVADGSFAVTWGDIVRTLDRLETLLPRLDAEPGLLAEQFHWVRFSDRGAFSGYYEPVFNASRTRKPGFVPLYALPPDLHSLHLGTFRKELVGQTLIYRLKKGRPVPYYTRAEIDGVEGKRGVLRGKGLELAWLADPVDAFFLHVQGSGRLRFEDGKEMPVRFAGSNGRHYLSIGKYLADHGEIPADKVSMQSIRHWLRANPEQRETLLQRNQRYIFFRKGSVPVPGSIMNGPAGNMGAPLSPMVSLAVDRKTFPLGAVVAFDVAIADPVARTDEGEPLRSIPVRGIGLAQDTGEAIRGRRVDLFCGEGDAAGFIAGHLNTPGDVWILLAK